MNGVNIAPMFDRIKNVLVKMLDAHADDVKPDADLADDLSMDSLDRVEMTMALEEEFNIQITDAEGEGLRTVQDIVTLVQGKVT